MRISRIQFANYRGICRFDLEVRDNLVLVGPNDTGKSSVLRGLNILLGTHGAQLQASLTVADFTDPKADVVLEVSLVGFSDEERSAFPDEITIVGDQESLRIRLEASVDVQDPDVVQIDRSFPESGLLHRLSGEQLRTIGWEYVSATRSLYKELGGSRSGLLSSLLGRVELGDEELALREALAYLSTIIDKSVSLRAFRGELASSLSLVLPGEVGTDTIHIFLPSELSDGPLSDAQIGLLSAIGPRTLNEQSDGVRALAAIAVYGLAHFGANIVGIDEPEMHLHPTAEKLVGRSLRSGSPQAVLATHSSYITSEFPPSQIAVLRPTGIVSQLPPTAPASDFYFAARWWHDQFIQPLTANCLAVVEGPSERILVSAVADALGLNLYRSGVHVFDLGGADQFKNAIIAFGSDGFGLRIVGLVDADRQVQWAKVLGVQPGELADHGIRVCDPDLEGEVTRSLGAERVIELLDTSGLFREQTILKRLQANRPLDVSDEDLAQYLRQDKPKVAAGLGRKINYQDASMLVPIAEMLYEAAS